MNEKIYIPVFIDEDGQEHEGEALFHQSACDAVFAYNEKYHLSAYVINALTGEVVYDV